MQKYTILNHNMSLSIKIRFLNYSFLANKKVFDNPNNIIDNEYINKNRIIRSIFNIYLPFDFH